MKYDVNYFIKKFEAIPEEKWVCGEFVSKDGRCCAQGFCGMNNENCDIVWFTVDVSYVPSHLQEAWHLINLFNRFVGNDSVPDVNNGRGCFGGASNITEKYPQSTPKARILAALNDIKELQNKDKPKEEETKTKVITKYVSVPSSITEQTKELIMQ